VLLVLKRISQPLP